MYFLNYLLGLVKIISDGQLEPTLASIMGFNPEATSVAVDQYLHLDIPPQCLYPDLVKWDYDELKKKLDEDPLTFESYPTTWLYFVAFDHGHAINLYTFNDGAKVMLQFLKPDNFSLPSEKTLQHPFTKTFLERLDFPFGSLAIAAGSLIHGGVGTGNNNLPMEPRFRLHSFCHVPGWKKGLPVHDTYLMQNP
jgi:hypothetical protein